jgi:hypothetical protein
MPVWVEKVLALIASCCRLSTVSYQLRHGNWPSTLKGTPGAPVGDATLIGNGSEALKYVSMVGNDLKLDEGVGTCGKDGRSVPVGVGIPTVKLDKMTVRGTRR